MKTSIRAILAVLLLALTAPLSFAQSYQPSSGTQFGVYFWGAVWAPLPHGNTAEGACLWAVGSYFDNGAFAPGRYDAARNACFNSHGTRFDIISQASTCPSGQYLNKSTGACVATPTCDDPKATFDQATLTCVMPVTCNFPFVRDPVTNGCYQPCVAAAGKLASSSEYVTLDGDHSSMTSSQMYSLIGKPMNTNLPTKDGHVCDAVGTVSSCYKLGSVLTCVVDNITFTGKRETPVPSVTVGDQAQKEGFDNDQCYAEMGGNRVFVPCDGVAKSVKDNKTDASGTTTTTGATATTKNPDGSTTTTFSSTTTNPDGSTTTKSTSITKNPDGSEKTTTSSETTNADGSKTSTKTTCTDGKCTSSSVKKDAQGNTTEQREQEKPKAEFCKDNPNDPACAKAGGSQYREGSCQVQPVCQGDAIQCAIAKLAWEQKCALIGGDGADELVQAGQAAVDGGLIPDGHPGAAPNVSQFDLQRLLNQSNDIAASCPPDVSFSVAGTSLTVPLSTMCPHIAMLGTIVHAFSLLAAAVIVFRG